MTSLLNTSASGIRTNGAKPFQSDNRDVLDINLIDIARFNPCISIAISTQALNTSGGRSSKFILRGMENNCGI